MKKLFENWRKHINEEQEIVTEDPALDVAYNAIAWTIAAIVLQYWPLSYSEVDSALKKIPDEKRKKLEKQIKQKFKEQPVNSLDEAVYEPGRAVADIDTGEERVEPEMLEKEAMQDLAEKFGVEVEFSTTKKGAPIAIVTFQDGQQMAYRDEEEMYQDLAQRREMNEGAVPHSAHHVVKKMKKTGKSAKETLKSLTHDLSDEEAERWLKRHKDEMDSAKQDLARREEK